MTVKMISYAKKLRQIYKLYLADNPSVMFTTTKQTANSPTLLKTTCRLIRIKYSHLEKPIRRRNQ